MTITIALLIYRSPDYLDFVMQSLMENESEIHDIYYLIVCNDATSEVLARAEHWSNMNGRIRFVDHRNENPDDWYIQNVYNAWNRCLAECDTPYICFVNSDMAFSPGWLDALARYDLGRYIPTSRLVESGRMPSLPGLLSLNYGQTLKSFQKDEFEKTAANLKLIPGFTPNVGAYMPSLFETETLKSIGGWRKNMGNIPGDRITFATLLSRFGMTPIMVHDSIVYHFQRGESAETGDLK